VKEKPLLKKSGGYADGTARVGRGQHRIDAMVDDILQAARQPARRFVMSFLFLFRERF
jgi:hypothetical protein